MEVWVTDSSVAQCSFLWIQGALDNPRNEMQTSSWSRNLIICVKEVVVNISQSPLVTGRRAGLLSSMG